MWYRLQVICMVRYNVGTIPDVACICVLCVTLFVLLVGLLVEPGLCAQS